MCLTVFASRRQRTLVIYSHISHSSCGYTCAVWVFINVCRSRYSFTNAVCPSVCLSNAGSVSIWMHMSWHFGRSARGIILLFSEPHRRYSFQGEPSAGAL